MPGAARGHSIDTIPTPALVLDATKVRQNIARMAAYTKAVGIANRPHTKTHKSVAIAGLQLAAGAVGLTVAKVGEAEILARAFADREPDILVAYPAVDQARTVRLAALARTATIRVAVDSPEAISRFDAQGLCRGIVSGGSTPTAYQSHLVRGGTEIRPGTCVYNDLNIVRGGFGSLDDCAAQVVCTVVSDAVSDQVILDGGSKALTMDRCGPAPDSGHGLVVEYPEAFIGKLTEEHAQVDVSRCRTRPRVGERVTVIPNHICPVVNLHDSAWWWEADGSLQVLPVDARGKLS